MRLNEAWENVRNIWCDNVATVFPSVWRTSFLQLYRPQYYTFIPLTIGWEGTIIVQPINNLEPELQSVSERYRIFPLNWHCTDLVWGLLTYMYARTGSPTKGCCEVSFYCCMNQHARYYVCIAFGRCNVQVW